MTSRRLGPRRVLIDTSAFFAMFNTRDPVHAMAAALLRRLTVDRALLLTTNFLVAETHGLLVSRRGIDMARRFLTEIYQSPTTIARVSEADEERARAIINQYTDKDFSYVDAMSFAVMERLNIGEAFTFDSHFRQYGFTILPSNDR